jgi:hypothetical protein
MTEIDDTASGDGHVRRGVLHKVIEHACVQVIGH